MTMQETAWEYGEYESEAEGESEFGEYEAEFGEYESESESEFGEYETEAEWEQEGESETLETELASELLEISNEQELEQFLGKLFRGAVRGVSNFARSSAGRALGGVLKGVARQALPWVGRAAGGFIGGPAGAMAGGALGSLAGRLFEVGEYETMSEQELEFELASRYVRFARAAARRAARAPRGMPPQRIAQQAAVTSARRYLPGLVRILQQRQQQQGGRQRMPSRAGMAGSAGGRRPRPTPSGRRRPQYGSSTVEVHGFDAEPYAGGGDGGGNGNGNGRKQTGRWVRRGGKIVVLGA